MRIVRSALALLAGLVLISVIVESLEFALVTLVNRGVTTDPDIYFSVRNRPAVLAAKLVYNTAAATVGGFVCAWLARRAPVGRMGAGKSCAQTIDAGLDVGLFDRSDIRRRRCWFSHATTADRAGRMLTSSAAGTR